jgi:hypothetical protein
MDPKAMARMLELRGDLLKALGEVMLKHAKAMGMIVRGRRCTKNSDTGGRRR